MPLHRFPTTGCFVGPFWLSRRGHSRQWCRTWFDGAGRQTRRASLRTDDLERAKVLLAEWHVHNAQLRHERPESVLIRDLVLRHIDRETPKKRSKSQIKHSLLALDERFPGRTVADLTPGMLIDWGRELLAASPTGSTEAVRRVLTDARAMLNLARKRGEVVTVPYVPVGEFAKGDRRRHAITVEEAAKLVLAIEDEWLRRFFWLAAATGSRTEALLELDVFRLDLDAGLVDFRMPGRLEGKKRRQVLPLARQLRPLLEGVKGPRVIGRGVKALVHPRRTSCASGCCSASAGHASTYLRPRAER